MHRRYAIVLKPEIVPDCRLRGFPAEKNREEFAMTRLILAVGLTLATVAAAWAACPPGTRYTCTQGYGGKVVCSCT